MATRVNYAGAIRKMRALGNVLHRPLRDVLDSGARVTAVQCARSSQPFGTGAEARTTGERAVARDISRVYATPGKAFEDIHDGRAKKAFWKAYKDGDLETAERLLKEFGGNLAGVPLERFDGGHAHHSARNAKTGRVNQRRPSMVVTNPAALARYVERIQRDVGTGKGGWADCVRAIGGTPRGLREAGDITANWITRKARGYGRAVHGGTAENPTIVITNRVPYADNILAGSALSEAKRIAHERMIKNLEIAVKSETSRLRTAA